MSAALPVHWLLPDGRAATLRQIAPDDFALESAFLDTLSMDTSYNRLFSTRHPSVEEIRHWTDIDPVREVAFVITTAGTDGLETMLAVGRAVNDDDGPDAEFALLVGDDSKRQDLGRHLLAALVDTARERGVRTLYGTTLSTNVGMLGLGRALGFGARREIGDSVLTRLTLRLGVVS
jgi:acetyltransferase